MRTLLKEWLNRYLPSETAGTISVLAASVLAYAFSHSRITAALMGTLAELLAYYGVMVYRETKQSKSRLSPQETYGAKGYLKDAGKLMSEFGFAEYLDTFLLRPYFLYALPLAVHNFWFGTLVGKVLADITFYVPTIIAYEIRKRFLKRRQGCAN